MGKAASFVGKPVRVIEFALTVPLLFIFFVYCEFRRLFLRLDNS